MNLFPVTLSDPLPWQVVTDSDVLDLVAKVRHLQMSGVKNIAKEFSSFHPDCTDWTSYHMTYQKLNQHFKSILNPNFNRRRSKNQPQVFFGEVYILMRLFMLVTLIQWDLFMAESEVVPYYHIISELFAS